MFGKKAKKAKRSEKTGLDRWKTQSSGGAPSSYRAPSDDGKVSDGDDTGANRRHGDKALTGREQRKLRKQLRGRQHAHHADRRKSHRRPREVRHYVSALVVLLIALGGCVFMFMPPSERITQGLDIRGGVSVIMSASKPDGSAVSSEDMRNATSIVQNRVNSLDASEATVQQQGANAILIQIPGATNAENVVSTIGRTGKLEFVKMADIGDADALAQIQTGAQNVQLKAGTYTPFMTGTHISSVSIGQQTNELNASYAVNVKLDGEGAKLFADVTKELAPTKGQIAIVLDGVVNSAPTVQTVIPHGDVSITGKYTRSQARELQTVLNSGSLPVTLKYSESRVVGPTLGQDSLMQGLIAITFGSVIVVLYLFFFYRGLGLLTFGSIVVFGVIYLGILATLSYYKAFALSLAGLAGVVLTIGMAADSSILVLERFREEIRMGKGVRTASVSGVKHGIGTSLDADAVTLVSALALFFLATGQVKGFGLTLTLGILCDIITMFFFKGPVLRLLARHAIQKHPKFWGVATDLEEAKAAQRSALSEREYGTHA